MKVDVTPSFTLIFEMGQIQCKKKNLFAVPGMSEAITSSILTLASCHSPKTKEQDHLFHFCTCTDHKSECNPLIFADFWNYPLSFYLASKFSRLCVISRRFGQKRGPVFDPLFWPKSPFFLSPKCSKNQGKWMPKVSQKSVPKSHIASPRPVFVQLLGQFWGSFFGAFVKKKLWGAPKWMV